MTPRFSHGGKRAGASTGSRFGRHVTAVMAEQPLRFTLESDAVQDAEWRLYVDELVALDQECDRISVTRAAGAVREAARGRPPEREARTALVDTLEAAPEAIPLDVSELGGEAQLVAQSEVDLADEIARLLTGKPFTTLGRSKREDVKHLVTHARHHRDVFVATNVATLAKREALASIGIRVEDPDAALILARERCAERVSPRPPEYGGS